MDKTLKAKIAKWVGRVGRKTAGAKLVTLGIHIDMAVRLLNGSYAHNPKREMLELIERAMNDDSDNF